MVRETGCCWIVGAWLEEAQVGEDMAKLSTAMTVALPLVRVNCQRSQSSWPAGTERLAREEARPAPEEETEETVVQVPAVTDPAPAAKIR